MSIAKCLLKFPIDAEDLASIRSIARETGNEPRAVTAHIATVEGEMEGLRRELAAQGFDVTARPEIVTNTRDLITLYQDDQQREMDLGKVAPTPPAPPFYSGVLRALEAIKMAKAAAGQWLATLKNAPGVKEEEMKWLRLDDWLKEQKGPITKDAMLDYLRANQLIVEEVVRGAGVPRDANAQQKAWRNLYYPMVEGGIEDQEAADLINEITEDTDLVDAGVPQGLMPLAVAYQNTLKKETNFRTKFQSYQLKDGENYREFLIRMPEQKQQLPAGWKVEPWGDGDPTSEIKFQVIDEKGEQRGIGDTAEVAIHDAWAVDRDSVYDGVRNRWPAPPEEYRKSHWSESNVVAHIRFNERIGDDGKKVLFIEEIQSDWHQQGRKYGYKGAEVVPTTEELEHSTDAVSEILEKNEAYIDNHRSAGSARRELHRNAVNGVDWRQTFPRLSGHLLGAELEVIDNHYDIYRRVHQAESSVPDAPFKTTWAELSMKRMLRWASENGFDRVAWTQGSEQVKRYTSGDAGLQRTVNRLEWKKDEQGIHLLGLRHGEEIVKAKEKTSALKDAIGEKLAAQIIDSPDQHGVIEEDNIKVSDTGMAEFYNKILINIANKLGKKFDTKVTMTDMKSEVKYRTAAHRNGETYEGETFKTKAEAEKWVADNRSYYEGDKYTLSITPVMDDPITGYSMDITPAMRESVMQGQPLFQGARGFITFGPMRDLFKITLTGKANLSTFLHESAHYFLEIQQDLVDRGVASPEQVADLITAKKHMGLAPDARINSDAHELWAGWTENYVMEGRAPSSHLQGMFDRFSAWLNIIYKKLITLSVPLNDEIRGVMDRRFASSEAIAEAKAQLGFLITPMSQQTLALTDQEYKTYVEAWTRAKDEAQRINDAKMMREAVRERKTAWRVERNKIKDELAKDLEQTPGYMAWRELEQRVDKIDPTTIPTDMAKMAVGLTSADGVPLDTMAEALGFESGQKMLEAVSEAKSANNSLYKRAKQIMEERHGVMDEAKIAEEAQRSLHHPGTTEILLTEYRAMAMAANVKVRPGITAFLRERAEQDVNQQTQQQLDPTMWRRAELKAAQNSAALAAKGKMQEAALAKRQQMMAAAMFRAVTEAADKIEKNRDYLVRFTKNDRRSLVGKAGQMYVDGIDQLLEGIDLKRVTAKELGKRVKLADVISRAAAADEPLTIPPNIVDLVTQKKNYSKLTVSELQAIKDSVTNLWTLAKLKNELRDGQVKRDLELSVNAMMVTAVASLGTRKPQALFTPSMRSGFVNKIRWARAKMVKMEFLFGWLDGQPDGGLGHRTIYQPLVDARYAEFNLLRGFSENLLDKVRAMSADQKARWEGQRTFMGHTVKGANIIAVALNLGNESNKSKLLRGYNWSEPQLRAEVDKFMTKEDWDMVQLIWDQTNTLWPLIDAVAFRSTGLHPKKVVAHPVDTQFGTYQGGYYPVVYDPDQTSKAYRDAERSAAANGLFANNFLRPSVTTGAIETRIESYAAPILLSLDVLSKHLTEQVHYVTHYDAVTQADKITRHPKFEAMVTATMGKEFYREIRPWLQDIAQNVTQRHSADFGEPFFRYLRTGTTIGAMGFNLLTGLKQLLGVATSLDAIGPLYWASGLQKTFFSPRLAEHWRFGMQNSKELSALIKDFDRDIKSINDTYAKKLGGGLKDFVIRHAFTHIGLFQLTVNMATWHGAYEQAIETNGGDHKLAVNHADSVVRKTQSSGAIKDLADIQRGGESSKVIFMFASFFSVLYNRLEDIHLTTRGIGDTPRAARRLATLILLPSILNVLGSDFYKAMFGHKDNKQDDNSFIMRVLLESWSYMLGTLPIIRSVGTFQFKPQLSPVVATGDKLARASTTMEKWIVKGERPTRKQALNVVDAAGIVTRTPGSSIVKLFNDVFGENVSDHDMGFR